MKTKYSTNFESVFVTVSTNINVLVESEPNGISIKVLNNDEETAQFMQDLVFIIITQTCCEIRNLENYYEIYDRLTAFLSYKEGKLQIVLRRK